MLECQMLSIVLCYPVWRGTINTVRSNKISYSAYCTGAAHSIDTTTQTSMVDDSKIGKIFKVNPRHESF